MLDYIGTRDGDLVSGVPAHARSQLHESLRRVVEERCPEQLAPSRGRANPAEGRRGAPAAAAAAGGVVAPRSVGPQGKPDFGGMGGGAGEGGGAGGGFRFAFSNDDQ